MTTTGYKDTQFTVKIRMSALLDTDQDVSSVIFFPPSAEPRNLEIDLPAPLMFNHSNWSTDQNVKVTGHRVGTLPMSYELSMPYTKRKTKGVINLTINPIPPNTFNRTADHIGTNGAFSIIGFIIADGTISSPVSIGGAGVLIGGTWRDLGTVSFSGAPGIYQVAFSDFSHNANVTAGTTVGITVTDTNGTRTETFTCCTVHFFHNTISGTVGPADTTPRSVNIGPIDLATFDEYEYLSDTTGVDNGMVSTCFVSGPSVKGTMIGTWTPPFPFPTCQGAGSPNLKLIVKNKPSPYNGYLEANWPDVIYGHYDVGPINTLVCS